MKKIIFDGNNFSDEKGFDLEVKRNLTKDITWIDYNKSEGLNLNAFNDFLRSNFNVTTYEEPYELVWKNFEKSKKDLSDDYNGRPIIERILEIIRDHKHITLTLE